MNVFMSGLFTSVHLRIPDLLPRFLGHRRAWMYVALNPDVQVIMISLNGRVPEVVTHDPAASKPHDLDNPFHDSKAQRTHGIAIAKAIQ